MNEESDISEFEPKIDNSNILTDHQQEKLNDLKVNVARENSKYLAAHPEIRAIVQLILRKVLSKQPKFGVNQFIADIFKMPKADLQLKINEYLKEKNLNTKSSQMDHESFTSNFSFELDQYAESVEVREMPLNLNNEEEEKFDLPASVVSNEIDDNLITDYLKTLYIDNKLTEY